MNKFLGHKIVIVILSISFSICFGCSKEPTVLLDGSFQYPQYMCQLINKKIKFLIKDSYLGSCLGSSLEKVKILKRILKRQAIVIFCTTDMDI